MPDIINTAYQQLDADASTDNLNTPALSGGEAQFTSDVSIDGALTVDGAIYTGSALSSGALSATSGTFSGRLSIAAGAPLTYVSGSSTTVVATTATATKSTTTTTTDNAVQAGDIILCGPSSLSAGLVLHAYASANSTITWSYSNVSTDNAAQVAINVRYAVLRLNA